MNATMNAATGAQLDARSDSGLDTVMTAAAAGSAKTLDILLRAPSPINGF